MANPTTNFGWVMPTATDLVTDLPADFAVFGQGVDTSMAYLLGGTTGQILSKTSATNMAFTWISNDQGDLTAITAGTGISVTSGTGPIPSVAIDTAVTVDKTTAQTLTNKTLTSPALTTPTISTLTTNGDLVYGTGSGALSRLGIGSSAQVLTVASGVPSWATPAASSGSFVYITTATFSASSSIDLSNIFSATYENYFLIGNYTCTDDNDLNFRYRVSGTDDSTSNYNRSVFDFVAGQSGGGRATSQTSGRLAPTRATGSRMSIEGYFIAPFLAQTKHSQMRTSTNSSSAIEQNFVDIGFNAATSFTGITIFPGAGTVTGTFSIFGIKNS